MPASAALLPDRKRLHLHHGPIDLVIGADGNRAEVRAAYTQAQRRFAKILDELVAELPLLRTEMPPEGLASKGLVAQRMESAVRPFWKRRITAMAAVAGAVADEVLQAMLRPAGLRRAYVNNGGDIAIYLEEGERFRLASPAGPIMIGRKDNVGGIATSGWRGRSFSLGIADSVTVLARSAAAADAAATLIANAVDLPASPKVKRKPACELAPDSDLRDRLVTVDVLPLNDEEVDEALSQGEGLAKQFCQDRHITAVSLVLNRKVRHVGDIAADERRSTRRLEQFAHA